MAALPSMTVEVSELSQTFTTSPSVWRPESPTAKPGLIQAGLAAGVLK